MVEKGTFDLSDLNDDLMKQISFFEISYPEMDSSGCVIFYTQNGDEYIISPIGTDWRIDHIVEKFPEINNANKELETRIINEQGFNDAGNWKILLEYCGRFFVRNDFFDQFYELYKSACLQIKEFPMEIVRQFFRKDRSVPSKIMVYITTQECWDLEEKRKTAFEKERMLNRLSAFDVPWIRYYGNKDEGYIRFWIRKQKNGTFSAFRWLIQVQKEQSAEGVVKPNGAVECYNLFLQKWLDLKAEEIDEFEELYCEKVICFKAGEFVRSYKNLEQAQNAADIRNEWIGWGNVNKKNIYMIDYEFLKERMEKDTGILIF